jgi:Ca-activated chloride channel family protein
MAFVAMNTPIDPSTLERPPLHLALIIEKSSWIGSNTVSLKTGIASIAQNLRPEDRVSLILMGATPKTVLTAALADVSAIAQAIDDESWSDDAVGLYDGLAEADRVLEEVVGLDAKRIVLVTSGQADAGITDPEHIVALGEAIAKKGVALGVVGIDDNYKANIPAALGSLGAGSYSFAADGDNLQQVLELEGETTLFPLATDFKMTIQPSPGYRVGRIYGVKRAFALPNQAWLNMPALFIGQREGSHDVGGGRRGGGGGLFVELIADPQTALDIGPDAPAFRMDASWTTGGGEKQTLSREIINPLRPGQNPDGMWPHFSDPERGKPFMMLNMYLGLRASVNFYSTGDCARSMGVIDMMQPSVEGWQGKFDDPDIDSDYQLMLMLRGNLVNRCSSENPIQPFNWSEASCMMI